MEPRYPISGPNGLRGSESSTNKSVWRSAWSRVWPALVGFAIGVGIISAVEHKQTHNPFPPSKQSDDVASTHNEITPTETETPIPITDFVPTSPDSKEIRADRNKYRPPEEEGWVSGCQGVPVVASSDTTKKLFAENGSDAYQIWVGDVTDECDGLAYAELQGKRAIVCDGFPLVMGRGWGEDWKDALKKSFVDACVEDRFASDVHDLRVVLGDGDGDGDGVIMCVPGGIVVAPTLAEAVNACSTGVK